MKHKLDIEQWPRKDHYLFFRQFEEPFFGLTINMDCTKGYKTAKETGASFFLFYLYQSLKAANLIESFRYRIEDDTVFVYDQVNASPTINRPDGTFGFAYFNYYPSLPEFLKEAQVEIENVQSSSGLVPAISSENVIHYSSLPWIHFTALSHARAFSFKDSIPKIAFGKMIDEGGKKIMPVSIHAHHALMDGYHVGEYINLFQQIMNAPV